MRQVDPLTVSPCALLAGPPAGKASGILQWCIEKQAVYCDLLHGVYEMSVNLENGSERILNVILAMLCPSEDLSQVSTSSNAGRGSNAPSYILETRTHEPSSPFSLCLYDVLSEYT